jgi:hypothetical protein
VDRDVISGYAGGHTFKDGVCYEMTGEGEDRRVCGRRLVDLQWVALADVNKTGIAHTGTATLSEIEGIIKLAKTMRKQVDTAFGWTGEST